MHKSEKTFDAFLDRAKLPIVPMEGRHDKNQPKPGVPRQQS